MNTIFNNVRQHEELETHLEEETQANILTKGHKLKKATEAKKILLVFLGALYLLEKDNF